MAQLRQRLGDLSAVVVQKDRLLAQQQAWSDKLGPLRQTLEALRARLVEPARGARRAAGALAMAGGVLVQTDAGPAMLPDPVLEAVIAQFALSHGNGCPVPVECAAVKRSCQ